MRNAVMNSQTLLLLEHRPYIELNCTKKRCSFLSEYFKQKNVQLHYLETKKQVYKNSPMNNFNVLFLIRINLIQIM